MLGKTSESYLSDHLYDLIYELNAIAPSVLLAVLPQLEFKLKVRILFYNAFKKFQAIIFSSVFTAHSEQLNITLFY